MSSNYEHLTKIKELVHTIKMAQPNDRADEVLNASKWFASLSAADKQDVFLILLGML